MTQAAHLQRVSANIAEHVMFFCRFAFANGGVFHMSELVRWVSNSAPIAPDSPSRILRQLRHEGRLDYEVVSRRESRYRVLAVRT